MLGKNKTVNTLACERQGAVAPGEPASKLGDSAPPAAAACRGNTVP